MNCYKIGLPRTRGRSPTLLSKLEPHLKCEVCQVVVTSPIRQCQNGHLTCDNCYTIAKLVVCPTCGARAATSRNTAAESIVASLRRYDNQNRLFNDEPDVHEERPRSNDKKFDELCEKRRDTCFCLCGLCLNKMPGSVMASQMRLCFGPSFESVGVKLSFRCSELTAPGYDVIKMNSAWTLKENPYAFVLARDIIKNSVHYYLFLLYCGTTDDISHKRYRILLKNNKRELLWEARLWNVNDSRFSMDRDNCLVLEEDRFNLFSTGKRFELEVSIFRQT